jgi:hypothetical protein
MATPFVTGLASQLLGQLPSRTPKDVAEILAQTSDKVGGGYGSDPYGTCAGCTWSSSFGYGRIDVARALSAPDFALAGSPSSLQVAQGSSGSYAVTASSVNGFNGSISYSVKAPLGVLASFSPASTGAPGSTQLSVTVTPAVAPGTYALEVDGSSGSVQHSTTVALVVTPLLGGGVPVGGPPVPAAPTGDFAMTIAPGGARISPGGVPVPFAIALTASSPAAVDLTVSGVPAGAAAVIAPTSTTAPGAATLTVVPGPTTPTGTYTITVTGTSGPYVHTATVTVVVLQPSP